MLADTGADGIDRHERAPGGLAPRRDRLEHQQFVTGEGRVEFGIVAGDD